MNIATIDGGWYGCHLATLFKEIDEVTLYEKNCFLSFTEVIKFCEFIFENEYLCNGSIS